MDDILARHKEEQKALTSVVIGLRKQAKNDKKKKKEIMAQIAQLEHELQLKHQSELTQTPTATVVSAPAPQEPKKKVNKARMRIEKRNAELDRIRTEAEAEAENTVDMAQLETTVIENKLIPLNLRIKQITADGHCLYNAFADQLRLRYKDIMTYQELRSLAAQYMREHPDDFMPFLYLEDGNYDRYCHDIEHTACWGGQLEILALAKSKQVPVDIVQMEGPVLRICEDEYPDKDIIQLAYHKHLFSLGAHYNSLVPV